MKWALLVMILAAACGSSSPAGGPPTGDAGADKTSGAAGSTGAAGTMGTAGTTGAGGTTGTAGTTGAGGTGGTQPVGSVCANTSNCSQADGKAVCCIQLGPACTLEADCPASPTYVSCATQPCAKAGWVCCDKGGMKYCTKQSGCQ
jgi:hypothetical protein